MRRASLACLLLASTACGTRRVEVQVGGRVLENLRARATEEGGRWTVAMDLPLGRWEPRLVGEGDVPVRVVPGQGHDQARWEVSSARLAGAPFRVTLQGLDAEGRPVGALLAYDLRVQVPAEGFVKGTIHVMNLIGGRITWK